MAVTVYRQGDFSIAIYHWKKPSRNSTVLFLEDLHQLEQTYLMNKEGTFDETYNAPIVSEKTLCIFHSNKKLCIEYKPTLGIHLKGEIQGTIAIYRNSPDSHVLMKPKVNTGQ